MSNEFDMMLDYSDKDFDPLTGQVLPEITQQRQEIVAAEAVADMEKLVSLEKHPGWRLVKAALEKTIEKEQTDLLHSSSETAFKHFQSSIKARKELLGWLEFKISEGKSLLEERNQAPTKG